MPRLGIALIACIMVFAFAAASAGARPAEISKLSPREQTWVKPLLNIFNVMNAELHVVIAEEEASNALIATSGKNNTALTKTLFVFTECTVAVKKVGKPPTGRMTPFLGSLEKACLDLQSGAKDVATAIGSIGKKHTAEAKTQLGQATDEFKLATSLLAIAERKLMLVGGSDVFEA